MPHKRTVILSYLVQKTLRRQPKSTFSGYILPKYKSGLRFFLGLTVEKRVFRTRAQGYRDHAFRLTT